MPITASEYRARLMYGRRPAAGRLARRWAALGGLLAALAICGVPGLAGAQSPSAPVVAPTAIKAVRVTTNMGSFVIELETARAPLSVQNFLRYVNEGFYANTLFHRVVGNFVAQAGGYDAGTLKLKGTHEYIVNESGNGLQNKRGTVGMARAGGAHTANSQFYVNIADNTDLDPLPTRWGYAVFGRVTEGMDVIDKMGVVATGSMGELKSDAPLKQIIIEKVEALAPAGTVLSPAAPVTPSATPPAVPATPAAAPGTPPATPAGSAPPPAEGTSPPPQ